MWGGCTNSSSEFLEPREVRSLIISMYAEFARAAFRTALTVASHARIAHNYPSHPAKQRDEFISASAQSNASEPAPSVVNETKSSSARSQSTRDGSNAPAVNNPAGDHRENSPEDSDRAITAFDLIGSLRYEAMHASGRLRQMKSLLQYLLVRRHVPTANEMEQSGVHIGPAVLAAIFEHRNGALELIRTQASSARIGNCIFGVMATGDTLTEIVARRQEMEWNVSNFSNSVPDDAFTDTDEYEEFLKNGNTVGKSVDSGARDAGLGEREMHACCGEQVPCHFPKTNSLAAETASTAGTVTADNKCARVEENDETSVRSEGDGRFEFSSARGSSDYLPSYSEVADADCSSVGSGGGGGGGGGGIEEMSNEGGSVYSGRDEEGYDGDEGDEGEEEEQGENYLLTNEFDNEQDEKDVFMREFSSCVCTLCSAVQLINFSWTTVEINDEIEQHMYNFCNSVAASLVEFV